MPEAFSPASHCVALIPSDRSGCLPQWWNVGGSLFCSGRFPLAEIFFANDGHSWP